MKQRKRLRYDHFPNTLSREFRRRRDGSACVLRARARGGAECGAESPHVRHGQPAIRSDRHLEITTIGDVPAGTGLGSSSSLAVGLLNALYAYKGETIGHQRLAELACEIEIGILGKPIGKQDQYAAAYGGMNRITFQPDGVVDVDPVPCRPETLGLLEDWGLMLYTADQRDADRILKQQSDGTADKLEALRQMRDLVDPMINALTGEGDVVEFARLLHAGWELKRSLGFGISYDRIDRWYEDARAAGALGGKLLGAGGGGFMLLIAPPQKHAAIREAVGRPREVAFEVDRRGSRIIFISEHQTLE